MTGIRYALARFLGSLWALRTYWMLALFLILLLFAVLVYLGRSAGHSRLYSMD